MRQLFKVGELVVIQSEKIPELNGTIYQVLSAQYGHGISIHTGTEDTGWTYHVNDGDHIPWCQEALRKYHPPSTQSFTEIMEELKGPVKA